MSLPMRPLTLALCGLATLSHALPVREEETQFKDRQFSLGPPSVTLCVGSCDPSSPIIWFPQPTGGGGFHIGRSTGAEERDLADGTERRSETDGIVASCAALASSLPPSQTNSAFRLIIESCLLAFQERSADPALLGSWTTIDISDKAKRQDDEIIIGACTEAEIDSLTAQFQAIVAQYGREYIPYDIAVLLEAIKAALFYCALASPTTGPWIPDDVIIGDPLIPDTYVLGGGIIPDMPVGGGEITPSDK